MATLYSGRTARARPRALGEVRPAIIRSINLSDVHDALRLGWEDFNAVPSHAIILCVIYPIIGLALVRMVLGYSVLPLLFPLSAGFALIGPFAALGLYELSRRRERGEDVTAWHVLRVLGAPSFGAMLGLGTILLGLFVIWVTVANEIYIATFGYEPAASIPDFLSRILTTGPGYALIVAGCGIGFMFAMAALCISVVSFPLMLDRHASARQAMRVSLQAVRTNPIPMTIWGLVVAALLVLGSLPFFVGLAVVLPVLGHSTWHLYRKVVG
jgi:uncharacterized membrane protein